MVGRSKSIVMGPTVYTGGGHAKHPYRKVVLSEKRDHMHMQMRFLVVVTPRIMERAMH